MVENYISILIKYIFLGSQTDICFTLIGGGEFSSFPILFWKMQQKTSYNWLCLGEVLILR